MKRPVHAPPRARGRRARLPRGFTLVELLTATVLTLLLMLAVVTVFAMVGEGVSNSQATLEMTGALQAATAQLQRDLARQTVTVFPPQRPESGNGYFLYTEGPVGPVLPLDLVAVNTDEPGDPWDTTVGDFDDWIAFTVQSDGEPFIGRAAVKRAPAGGETAVGTDSRGPFVFDRVIPIESQVAEIIYFVRGRTLYRRMLVVQPNLNVDLDERTASVDLPPRDGFYAVCDLSVHLHYDLINTSTYLVPNTLSDLTKPECRFAHDPDPRVFPSHPHFGANAATWRGTLNYYGLTLPTLCECSYNDSANFANSWIAGDPLPALTLNASALPFDAWVNPHPWDNVDVDPLVGAHRDYFDPNNVPATQRVGEDVILTNVVGFDVKVLDPAAPVVFDGTDTTALMPGDPGYVAALNGVFSGANTIISYGAYVDLNYMCLLGPESNPVIAAAPEPAYRDAVIASSLPEPHFYGAGRLNSRVRGTEPDSSSPPSAMIRPSVYDTWSFHYEHDWVDADGSGAPSAGDWGDQNGNNLFDEGTNGFDDDGDGLVDEPDEMETSPPYPHPVRSIQIKIRVFEPDSRQVREVTVERDFLPK